MIAAPVAMTEGRSCRGRCTDPTSGSRVPRSRGARFRHSGSFRQDSRRVLLLRWGCTPRFLAGVRGGKPRSTRLRLRRRLRGPRVLQSGPTSVFSGPLRAETFSAILKNVRVRRSGGPDGRPGSGRRSGDQAGSSLERSPIGRVSIRVSDRFADFNHSGTRDQDFAAGEHFNHSGTRDQDFAAESMSHFVEGRQGERITATITRT